MKTYLGSQDVWDVVQGGFEEPEDFDEQTVAQIATLKKKHESKIGKLCMHCTELWTMQALRS